MRTWILDNMGQVLDLNEVPMKDRYHGALGRALGGQHGKMLLTRGNLQQLRPDNAVWLGGICTLFTADGERIRTGEMTFATVDSFEQWLRSWYPRLDQVHDCLGVPPRGCKQAMYVVEDTIFGRRIGKWTGLPADEIAAVIRRVHEELGKPIIQAWHRCYGWEGELQVVYTSDIESELELAFRILCRTSGKKIKNGQVDTAKVELMYTTAWLDILGISEGVISEPLHHGLEGVITNIFPREGLWQLGFLPFWSADGPTRLQPLEQVWHRGNWQQFQVRDSWDAVNLQFTAKRPLGFSLEQLQERCMRDLAQVFGG